MLFQTATRYYDVFFLTYYVKLSFVVSDRFVCVKCFAFELCTSLCLLIGSKCEPDQEGAIIYRGS